MISRAGAPFLCRAMSGGYRFTKHKTGALKTVPEKNDKEGFSHVADDLQYVSLVVHGGRCTGDHSTAPPANEETRCRFSRGMDLTSEVGVGCFRRTRSARTCSFQHYHPQPSASRELAEPTIASQRCTVALS
jgi:hypothetical protein